MRLIQNNDKQMINPMWLLSKQSFRDETSLAHTGVSCLKQEFRKSLNSAAPLNLDKLTGSFNIRFFDFDK